MAPAEKYATIGTRKKPTGKAHSPKPRNYIRSSIQTGTSPAERRSTMGRIGEARNQPTDFHRRADADGRAISRGYSVGVFPIARKAPPPISPAWNPSRPAIAVAFRPNRTAQVRREVEARSFRLKLNALPMDIRENGVLGTVGSMI